MSRHEYKTINEPVSEHREHRYTSGNHIGQNVIIAGKITGRAVEIIPYAGTEQAFSTDTRQPTYDINSEWHNRPA